MAGPNVGFTLCAQLWGFKERWMTPYSPTTVRKGLRFFEKFLKNEHNGYITRDWWM